MSLPDQNRSFRQRRPVGLINSPLRLKTVELDTWRSASARRRHHDRAMRRKPMRRRRDRPDCFATSRLDIVPRIPENSRPMAIHNRVMRVLRRTREVCELTIQYLAATSSPTAHLVRGRRTTRAERRSAASTPSRRRISTPSKASRGHCHRLGRIQESSNGSTSRVRPTLRIFQSISRRSRLRSALVFTPFRCTNGDRRSTG